MYDPLRPLVRIAEKDPRLESLLFRVFHDFVSWTGVEPRHDPRRYRVEAAWVLGESLERHGLRALHDKTVSVGSVTPETLLFSAFGVPKQVVLKT
jgi:hypothetical protein